MNELSERVRSEAAIASRPGQMARLEEIADAIDALAANAWDEGALYAIPRIPPGLLAERNPYRSTVKGEGN